MYEKSPGKYVHTWSSIIKKFDTVHYVEIMKMTDCHFETRPSQDVLACILKLKQNLPTLLLASDLFFFLVHILKVMLALQCNLSLTKSTALTEVQYL